MLDVKALSFGFRHRQLFTDISFQVKPGELLQIAGPNGAGKSTLMSVLAGLLSADRGDIEYHPSSGTRPAEDRRQYMEYLPAEANGLYTKMDAMTNLRFWMQLRGLATAIDTAETNILAANALVTNSVDERILAELRRWKLDQPFLRNGFPVEKFSTGMKRRLALARLSLSLAPCWLLDEPLYGLDSEAMQTFRLILHEHLQRGGMAVLVSHELGLFHELITRALTLGSATISSVAHEASP